MEQKISTPLRHKYLTKLLGFDYSIEYRKGRENVAVDALSRREDMKGECIALTVLKPAWVEELQENYEGDALVPQVITESPYFSYNLSLYTYNGGLVRYKGKLYMGGGCNLREKIIEFIHNSALGGHSGEAITYHKVLTTFWWPDLKRDVRTFVIKCHVCQLCKYELVKSPGLLQPLPIPSQAWSDISINFIEKLPNSRGCNTIWVIVDRLTKYGHFIALSHPYTASQLTQIFLDSIYKLHGLPISIVSHRDKVFTSGFWQQLFKLIRVQRLMSTAYHPQTDGQTERVNQCLEGYLGYLLLNFGITLTFIPQLTLHLLQHYMDIQLLFYLFGLTCKVQF